MKTCRNPECNSVEFTIVETIVHKAGIDPENGNLDVLKCTDNFIDGIECNECGRPHTHADFTNINF